MKGKREKERYTHLNAEFQRIPRRDKKGFLSDQCKEIEENNRMALAAREAAAREAAATRSLCAATKTQQYMCFSLQYAG